VFDTPLYKGKLFRIDEPVVDPVSVLRELARGVAEETFLVTWGENATLLPGDEGLSAIRLRETDGGFVEIKADSYLLAAGAGNAELLRQIGHSQPAMQRRPLHQVVVRKA